MSLFTQRLLAHKPNPMWAFTSIKVDGTEYIQTVAPVPQAPINILRPVNVRNIFDRKAVLWK